MVGKVPKWMQAVVWSVNVDKLDLNEDKYYIILQSLNYGTDKVIDWLWQNYQKQDIVNVLKKPGRGVWQARVLNYWQKKLGVTLTPEVKEAAIKSIYPKNGSNILASN